MGPTVEIDFGDVFRLDPDRPVFAALFGRQLLERRRFALDRLELSVKLASELVRIAGAATARVNEFATPVISERERANRMGVRGRGRKSADHQFLTVAALGFQPVCA